MLQHFTFGVFCIKWVYFNIIMIYTVTVGQMQALSPMPQKNQDVLSI